MVTVLNLVSPGHMANTAPEHNESIKAIMTTDLNQDTVVPTVRFIDGEC